MEIALSPYHLTTREAPALAAVQLARRVVTMLPAPRVEAGQSARERAEEAAAAVPRYLAFMETWRWSTPLWTAGVVTGAHRGQTAEAEVRAVWNRLAEDPELAELRPLMRHDLFDTEQHYLEALARDLLKGGPDPGISLPVNAALDRFATRHGLMVARSQAVSVAQKAEERLARRVFAVAIPALVQAESVRVIWVREELGEVLEDLREAVEAVMEDAVRAEDAGDEGTADAELVAEVELAARAYTQAFDAVRNELARAAAEDEVRAVAGTITMTAVRLPVGAVLDSGVTAVRTMSGTARRMGAGGSGRTNSEAGTLPVRRDPLAGRWFTGLVFKAVGRTTGRAGR